MNLSDWICPACKKKSEIEEVMVSVPVASILTAIEPDGFVEYDEQVNVGGDIVRFQCAICGFILIDNSGLEITSVEELYKHLSNSEK